MRTPLIFTHPQLAALHETLLGWLDQTTQVEPHDYRRITALEVLAIKPAQSVLLRIQAQLLNRRLRVGKPAKKGDYTLRLDIYEMTALFRCLPWQEDTASELTVAMGIVHQKLTAYDQYLVLD